MKGAEERQKLVREAFELERDIFYRKFRGRHFDLPEIVDACPDPALRERMLRGFWNQDAEKRYAEYQHNTASMSVSELAGYRDFLKGELVGRPRDSVVIDFARVLHGEGKPGNNQPEQKRDSSSRFDEMLNQNAEVKPSKDRGLER